MENIELKEFEKEIFKMIHEAQGLRSKVLIMHIIIEILMNKIIEKKFKNPTAIFENYDLKYSFSNKADLLSAVGVNKVIVEDVKTVNKIRNIFAHELFLENDIPKDIEKQVRDNVMNIIKRHKESFTDDTDKMGTIELIYRVNGHVTGYLVALVYGL
jgi:hypothetical protein